MRVIFYVDGKVFYKRADFKSYLLKTGKVDKGYRAKLGIYWMKAYLERTRKSTMHTKKSRYDVKLYRDF